MSAGTNHSGVWQAQGDDIPKKGHAFPWNENECVTKSRGLLCLANLSSLCTSSQRELREKARADAMRYIQRAPAAGIEAFHMKSFPVKSPPISARRARVDLEIIVGHAFCDDLKGSR